ncbi:uncharacterized protein EI90DRAFT_3028048, partial [Cantharellus anzutake]|uniref:uncharacterized protein n=1 Tax=Cantharellus anzutake TaxID=1750568 RepID=UPI0019079A70
HKSREKRNSETALEAQEATYFSSGDITIFSPCSSEVMHSLSRIWTSDQDGILNTWSLKSGQLINSCSSHLGATGTGRTPYFSITHFSSKSSHVDTLFVGQLRELATFIDHASRLLCLRWISVSYSDVASIAEGDRFVSIWKIPALGDLDDRDSSSSFNIKEGILIASIPFDTDTSSSISLLVLSASGSLHVYPIPITIVSSPSKKQAPPINLRPLVATAGFAASNKEAPVIRIARYIRGARPIPIQRYREAEESTLCTGNELVSDGEDPYAALNNEAELDGDMAELSPGEKLPIASAPPPLSTLDLDLVAEGTRDLFISKPSDPLFLIRTLVQALHTSDSELLETVLNTSEDSVVVNTIRKSPAIFAAPLIQECVSRLCRGIGSAGLKWLRATLIVHVSFLLTDPQLAKRLTKLHTTIASRVAFQDRLLALHGRLDLLVQIEMRSRNGESALVSAAALAGKVYVEGESGGEDVEMDENEGSIEDVQLSEESAGESGSADEGDDDDDDEDDDDEDEDEEDGEEEDE